MNKKILFLVLLAVILILPFVAYAEGEFCAAVGKIKTLIVQIGGSMVVIGWVVAGILYLAAAGSPEKTGIAKKAMIAAIIGTVLVVIAGGMTIVIGDAIGWVGVAPMCP